MPARLARISLYPIKSLPPVGVQHARLLPSGPLQDDRRFALVDDSGVIVTAKRTTRIHAVRATFELAARCVILAAGEARQPFHLDQDRVAMEQWLSEILSLPVKLIEDAAVGFPDDLESSGPTVISTATLETVAGWFGLNLDEVRRRFRASLEVEGVEPFWEDQLAGESGRPVAFRIGGVTLLGTNPCQRCAVPSRDSQTGEVLPGFARMFAEHRQRTLPARAPRARFDHYYRLATNTRLHSGETLQVGDAVELLGAAD